MPHSLPGVADIGIFYKKNVRKVEEHMNEFKDAVATELDGLRVRGTFKDVKRS